MWREGISINENITFLPLHPLLSFSFLNCHVRESFRSDNRFSSVRESMYDIRNTGKFVLSFSTRTEKCRFCTKKTRPFTKQSVAIKSGERDAQDSFHEQSKMFRPAGICTELYVQKSVKSSWKLLTARANRFFKFLHGFRLW